MGSLLVITGPPGAGKSTVARILSDRYERSVLVEGDAFFGFLARGAIAPWLPESNEQNAIVIRAAAAASGRYADGGCTTVFDGIVGPWFLPALAAATARDRIDYAMLMPSVQCCVDRVAHRPDHGFTDEPATRKKHAEFVNATIEERHVVVDPPDRAELVADLVAARWESDALRFVAAAPRTV